MHHEPHVRLVHAHAERDRRDDDGHAVAGEVLLRLPSNLRRQSRVVGARPPPSSGERRRHVLRLLPGEAVDDGRIPPTPLQQHVQLPLDVVLRPHRVAQVRAVEARHEHLGPLEVELLHDVPPHPLRRRRRQRQQRRPREHVAKLPQVAVVRPELVPPLGDAMRLVDGDQAHPQPAQEPAKPLDGQPLRRDVQDLDESLSNLPHHPLDVPQRKRAVNKPSRNAIGVQPVHLVLHQRDQRRDHQRHPIHRQRRQLVAQRLPTARRHQQQRVPASQHPPYNNLLLPPKALKPKVSLQNGMNVLYLARRHKALLQSEWWWDKMDGTGI